MAKELKTTINESFSKSELYQILVVREYAKYYSGRDLEINVNMPHFKRIINFLRDNDIPFITNNEYEVPSSFDLCFGSDVDFQNLYIITSILKLFGLQNLYYTHEVTSEITVGFLTGDTEQIEYENIDIDSLLEIPFHTSTEKFLSDNFNLSVEKHETENLNEEYPKCKACKQSKHVYNYDVFSWFCSFCDIEIDIVGDRVVKNPESDEIENSEELCLPICEKCFDSENVSDPGGDYWWCSNCKHNIDIHGVCMTFECSTCEIEDSKDSGMPICEKCGDSNDVSYFDGVIGWCSHCKHNIDIDGVCMTFECSTCEIEDSEETELPICEKCGDSNDVSDPGGDYWWCSHCEHYINGLGECTTEDCSTCEIEDSEETEKPICGKCGDSKNVTAIFSEVADWYCQKCKHDINADGVCLTKNCKTCRVSLRFLDSLRKYSINNNYLFFDLETVGLPKDFNAPISKLDNWPRIVQIAWTLYDSSGNQISKKEYVVKPIGFRISSESTKIHGITTEKAMKEGDDLKTILIEFEEQCLKSKYLIAHNVNFDTKILGAEFLRLYSKNPLSNLDYLCTMTNSVEYCKIPGLKGHKWPKLEELHLKLFGYNFDNAHNATADVEATAKCFWEMRRLKLI